MVTSNHLLQGRTQLLYINPFPPTVDRPKLPPLLFYCLTPDDSTSQGIASVVKKQKRATGTVKTVLTKNQVLQVLEKTLHQDKQTRGSGNPWDFEWKKGT